MTIPTNANGTPNHKVKLNFLTWLRSLPSFIFLSFRSTYFWLFPRVTTDLDECFISENEDRAILELPESPD
jgi:hypothetical protein